MHSALPHHTHTRTHTEREGERGRGYKGYVSPINFTLFFVFEFLGFGNPSFQFKYIEIGVEQMLGGGSGSYGDGMSWVQGLATDQVRVGDMYQADLSQSPHILSIS